MRNISFNKGQGNDLKLKSVLQKLLFYAVFLLHRNHIEKWKTLNMYTILFKPSILKTRHKNNGIVLLLELQQSTCNIHVSSLNLFMFDNYTYNNTCTQFRHEIIWKIIVNVFSISRDYLNCFFVSYNGVKLIFACFFFITV